MTGPPPTEQSDGELVRHARTGSRPAMEALFRRHGQMVHGLTYRLLGRPSDAEEVAQDTLAAAFRALPRLRDPDRFAPWLRGICIKKCRSRIRSLTVRRRFGVVDHAPLDLTRYASADASPDVIAELRLLARCVDRLTTEERIVLMLVRVEGLTLPETADQIGLSLATVKRRLSRAAARLEKMRGGRDD